MGGNWKRCAMAGAIAFGLSVQLEAEFTYLYSFGSAHVDQPYDVAVYAPSVRKQYVFVTDQATNELVRFRFDGKNSFPVLHYPATYLEGRVGGVAVNDIPGHCNQGQVYVVEAFPFPATAVVIHVFDLNGVLLMDLAPTASGPHKARIDCDTRGDVYLTDYDSPSVGARVLKFDAAHFDPSNHGLSWSLPPDQEFVVPPSTGIDGGPLDVSVDLNGYVHVTHVTEHLVRYRPDGTIQSITALTGGLLQGVDATGPLGHVWTTNGELDRYVCDAAGVPTLDLAIGDLELAVPTGVEYQKFHIGVYNGFQIKTRSEERVFVADLENGEIDVFGESTLSTLLPPGAVAWWRFSEIHDACIGTLAVVRDSAGPNDGVVMGAFPPPATAEGAVGDSLRFDALGSFVSVPSDPTLDFGAGNFTIEGWVRTEDAVGTTAILDKRTNQGTGYHVYLHDGRIGIQLNGGGTAVHNSTNVNGFLADGFWHHFAFVVNRNLATITSYVDGVATVDTIPVALAGLLLDTTAPLLIGKHSSFAWDFVGGIDELTLYSRALAPAEIDAVWLASYAGKSGNGLIRGSIGAHFQLLSPWVGVP